MIVVKMSKTRQPPQYWRGWTTRNLLSAARSSRIVPLLRFVLSVESGELIEGRGIPTLAQQHYLVIDKLAARGIERTLVTVHHTLHRRTVDARSISIASFVDADSLWLEPAVSDKTTPADGSGIGCRVNILHPSVVVQFLQLLAGLVRGCATVCMTILVAQLGQSVANGLMSEHLTESLALKMVDDGAQGNGILHGLALRVII